MANEEELGAEAWDGETVRTVADLQALYQESEGAPNVPDDPEAIELALAEDIVGRYKTESYEGHVWVTYRIGKQRYVVDSGHCSCSSFSWSPTEIDDTSLLRECKGTYTLEDDDVRAVQALFPRQQVVRAEALGLRRMIIDASATARGREEFSERAQAALAAADPDVQVAYDTLMEEDSVTP